MTAGKLNRRVTVQKPDSVLDEYGQPSTGWVNIATVWANIKPVSGREKMRAMAMEATLTHTVMVRYRPDLLPEVDADTWRILYGTKVLDVTSAVDLNDERKYIVFDCVETGVN